MTLMMRSCFVTLAILFLWRVEEGAEACKCIPIHPQQGFCNSDVVIRARVSGRHEIDDGGMRSVKYSIKGVKVFKSLGGNINAVYTSLSSASCGVILDIGKQYLLTGRLENGKVRISSCDYIELWDSLSANLRLNLDRHYGNGCSCQITYCSSAPCVSSNPGECLWDANDEQTKNDACLRRRDGSCYWHKGGAPGTK